jgi:3-oxoadipate enol-lactonase
MSPVELHYTVDGPESAPLLLLGSSLGTTSALWRHEVPALAAEFRVVRYDHRGHGGSSVPPGPYTIADLGQDLIALLDRLGVERAHLAGISLTAMASMWAAAHAPERVERLAVLCTSARYGPAQMWANRAATVRSDGLEVIADAIVARWTPPTFAEAHPDVVAWLRAMLVATPPEGYAGCCQAIETMDLVADLASITAPTLVVAGLADEATPPTHAQLIVDNLPGARLALAAGAAHLPHISRPDVIVDLLLSFLGGLNDRADSE